LSPEVGRAAFPLGFVIVLVAGALLVMPRPGTPEFALTVLSLLIGPIFMGIIIVFVCLSRP
jgi:hypothetical protein